MNRILTLFACTTLLLASAVAARADEGFVPSTKLRQAIADDWNRRVKDVTDDFLAGLEEPVFLRLELSNRQPARDELAGIIRAAIGWQAVSDRLLNAIVGACETAVLEAVEATLETDEALSEQVQQQYSRCYHDTMDDQVPGAVMSLMGDPNLIATLSRYDNMFASYQWIAPSLTTAALEDRFGKDFDEIIDLLSMPDDSSREARIDELKRRLESEAAVWQVSLQDPGHNGSVYGRLFNYRRASLPWDVGSKCRGGPTQGQEGMARCSWTGEGFGRDNVIMYTRYFTFSGERLKLEARFDYAELLAAVEQ